MVGCVRVYFWIVVRFKWLIKPRKIVYDDTWRLIMKEVSVETKIPLSDIERINTAWWKYVSEMMGRVELPRIRMMYLITLRPSPKKLFGYCEKVGVGIEKLMRGESHMSKSVGDVVAMSKHLWRLQETYFRLEREGKITGKRYGVWPGRLIKYRYGKK